MKFIRKLPIPQAIKEDLPLGDGLKIKKEKENKTMDNKGYMFFSADGTKPKTTLAALGDAEGVRIIVEGQSYELIKMFGSIYHSLATKTNIKAEDLRKALVLVDALGESFVTLLEEARKAFESEEQ